MGVTTDRKADINYKYLKGLASTYTERASYEETHKFAPRIFPDQMWLDVDSIPAVAPGGIDGEVTGAVKRVIDSPLTQEAGKVNAWFSLEFKDAVDVEHFGATYLVEIKDSNGDTLPVGIGNYEINYDAGTLTFDDDFVPTDTPLTASFYQYVGAKGSQSPNNGTMTWLTDVAKLRGATVHDADDVMGVFETNALYIYQPASAAADDGEFVIKPADVTGNGRWILNKRVPSASHDLVMGTAPDTKDWADGLIPIDATTKQNFLNYELNRYIKLLAPDSPTAITATALTLVGSYQAYEAGTGTEHLCSDSSAVYSEVSGVLDMQAGDLYSMLDAIDDGVITLTTGDNVGADASLAIIASYDPYDGVDGKEGFYKAIDLTVTQGDVAVGEHSMRIRHSTAGQSEQLTWYRDDPEAVIVALNSTTLPVATEQISGVPTLLAAEDVTVDVTVSNAVNTHYGVNISKIESTTLAGVTIPIAGTPADGDPVGYVQAIQTLPNVYSEDIGVTIYGYNSKQQDDYSTAFGLGARLDSISDESNRLVAGSGQYPATGYGADYDSTISLITTYSEELQLKGGLYGIPTGDYTGNLPTAGPDYSTGMGTGWRYVMPFTGPTLSAASGFTLNFLDSLGLNPSDLDTDLIRVQVKVEGATGWLDANSSFTLVGAPVADGDPCMVYNDSTGIKRRISFGNVPRSGVLYIRIGIPYDSAKAWGTITITDLV